jgi:hypothetical protein
MSELRISAPSAETAHILVEMLAPHGATATSGGRQEGWEVVVPVSVERGAVPGCLKTVQSWLDICQIASAAITLDGHAHLLRSDSGHAPVRLAQPD